jgi:hypothetical protein
LDGECGRGWPKVRLLLGIEAFEARADHWGALRFLVAAKEHEPRDVPLSAGSPTGRDSVDGLIAFRQGQSGTIILYCPVAGQLGLFFGQNVPTPYTCGYGSGALTVQASTGYQPG